MLYPVNMLNKSSERLSEGRRGTVSSCLITSQEGGRAATAGITAAMRRENIRDFMI